MQSAALELWSSWKQRLLYDLALSCLEPVGGGAVDVDHVADVAFTFSCLLPETHGIGWCRKVNRVNCLDVSPVATHNHETAIVDGHREVGARLQHIGHLGLPLKWLVHT